MHEKIKQFIKDNKAFYEEKYKKKNTENLKSMLIDNGVDLDKTYTSEEFKEIIEPHLKGYSRGLIKYRIDRDYTGWQILDIFVTMLTAYDMSFFTTFGDADIFACIKCFELKSESLDAGAVSIDDEGGVICSECRRKIGQLLTFSHFVELYRKEKYNDFINEELSSGLNYKKYLNTLKERGTLKPEHEKYLS